MVNEVQQIIKHGLLGFGSIHSIGLYDIRIIARLEVISHEVDRTID